jgi:hypothetical protein
MAGPIVVFTGPTLSAREAALACEALYLPPADQGAVYYAVEHLHPCAIVLIDGIFGHVPTVRHKEILWALHRGIPVYGAGSLGALRAAELCRQGMIGWGMIYRWYRRTPLADDDAVAVAMGPVELGAPALSDALVNIRISLRQAEREGMVDAAARRNLVAKAASTYFMDRSYARLLEDARHEGMLDDPSADRLRSWLAINGVDQKRDDALALLKMLADGEPPEPSSPIERSFVLTEAWLEDLAAGGFDVDVPHAEHHDGQRR